MTPFAAVTYNVLAQSYAYPDRYPLSPPAALDPGRRRTLLLDRIVGLESDLLCLQEVEPDVYSGLSGRLDATHHGEYVRRTPRPEGVAVFARRSVFDWRGHEVLHFAYHRRDDDDLALVVTLSLGANSGASSGVGLDPAELRVACAHLPWRPDSTPLRDHTGYRQMVELLDFRDATAVDACWIFAGDFNAEVPGPVLDAALARGMAESCTDQVPAATAAVNGHSRKIDYLLYSAGRLDPDPGELPPLHHDTAMPSLSEPSDHLPLRVSFTVADR